MEYSEAIKYLFEQLPMYQRVGPAAYKNNLDNTLALDEMFNHPHLKFKSIHVAGTNGKGSVSHLLAAVLQSAGYKVGLYTSPHLKDYRERIKVNGEMISKDAVCDFLDIFIEKNRSISLEPSFFELSVLMAFDYFAKMKVDFAVVEVGLGGRLDSTNIITPQLSVITNISLDHIQLLGNTLEKIAAEKAGIIKKDVPVVIGEYQPESAPVFIQKAAEQNAKIVFADNDYMFVQLANGKITISNACSIVATQLELDLKGHYQQKNIVTAVAAVEVLRKKGLAISNDELLAGAKNVVGLTGLLGRWQKLGELPTIICDTGHNEAGIKWVVGQLEKEEYNLLHIVFGAVNDKDIDKVLKLLPKNAMYYFTQAAIDRALDVNKLYQHAVELGLKGNTYRSVAEAFSTAKVNAKPNDMVFIGGSTFVVAEVL